MRIAILALLLACTATTVHANDVCRSAMDLATDAGNLWKGLIPSGAKAQAGTVIKKKYFEYQECEFEQGDTGLDSIRLLCTVSPYEKQL